MALAARTILRSLARTCVAIATATASLGFVAPAIADVDLYIAPQFGISALEAEADGQVFAGVGVVPLEGQDHDASPLIGLGVGVEIPMDELVPREWLADIRLPHWPMRFELEASGLRDYDFRTIGSGASAAIYTSEIKATTLVANVWSDVPLNTMWRPIQYVFGMGRQPRVRQWLEPANFYFGGGVGFAAIEIDGTDNVFTGEDDFIDFAWNVGAGVNYRVTDRVTLSSGYRYVGLGLSPGSADVDLIGPSPNGELDYDLQIHEFRVAIQVRLYSFRGVWR